MENPYFAVRKTLPSDQPSDNEYSDNDQVPTQRDTEFAVFRSLQPRPKNEGRVANAKRLVKAAQALTEEQTVEARGRGEQVDQARTYMASFTNLEPMDSPMVLFQHPSNTLRLVQLATSTRRLAAP